MDAGIKSLIPNKTLTAAHSPLRQILFLKMICYEMWPLPTDDGREAISDVRNFAKNSPPAPHITLASDHRSLSEEILTWVNILRRWPPQNIRRSMFMLFHLDLDHGF